MGSIREEGDIEHSLSPVRRTMRSLDNLLEGMGGVMNTSTISTQLELVRECYHRVSSAHNFWTAYRRAAGDCGTATPELPQFASLLTDLTRTAEELDRKIAERRKRFDAVPILQALLRFKDGTTRKVAVSKPTGEIEEPFIGEMFHAALVKQGVVSSLETYPVLVVDKRKRIVAEIPTER